MDFYLNNDKIKDKSITSDKLADSFFNSVGDATINLIDVSESIPDSSQVYYKNHDRDYKIIPVYFDQGTWIGYGIASYRNFSENKTIIIGLRYNSDSKTFEFFQHKDTTISAIPITIDRLYLNNSKITQSAVDKDTIESMISTYGTTSDYDGFISATQKYLLEQLELLAITNGLQIKDSSLQFCDSIREVNENGFYLVDSNMNIGRYYKSETDNNLISSGSSSGGSSDVKFETMGEV